MSEHTVATEPKRQIQVHTSPDLRRAVSTPTVIQIEQMPTLHHAAVTSVPPDFNRTPIGGSHTIPSTSMKGPWSCPSCIPFLQAKLAISQPDDEYEREADRVAERVMRMPGPILRPRRTCPLDSDHSYKENSDEEPLDKTIMKKEVLAATQYQIIPPGVHEALSSSGELLDLQTRAFFEPRFNQDFSHVRVHRDAKAAESAKAVNALAYTVGRDIMFAADQYLPSVISGQRLIAHELTHVIQQGGNLAWNPKKNAEECSLSECKTEQSAPSNIHIGPSPKQMSSQIKIARQPAHAPMSAQVPPFFGLDAASDAFHGIVLFYMVTALPHTDYVDMSMIMRRGPYLIAPNLRRNPDGSSSIGYYIAFRKEPGFIGPTNWNEYAIGPDSIEEFLGNLNTYAGNGAFPYMFGPPAPNSIAAAAFVNNLMAGEFGAAFRAYGASWYESIKDPNWWVQMLTASAGLFRGPAVTPRAPTPGTITVPEAPLVPSSPPTLTIIRGGGAPATTPVGRVGGLVYATEGSTALAVQPLTAPAVSPAPSPLRVVPPIPAVPAPAPVVPAAPTAPGVFIPPQVAATVTAVIAAGAPKTAPGVAPAIKPAESKSKKSEGKCQFPTGLTMLEAIPMVWYKVRANDYYPASLTIQGNEYDRDDPNNPKSLSRGEPIGVPEQYWPHLGKRFQLLPETRGPNADRFRAVLQRYGFSWLGLQADHVQDLQWEGPDRFENLWPLSSSANLSAGPRQNNNQTVSFCETKDGPLRANIPLQQMKAEGRHFGRWFYIRRIER